MTRHSPYQPNPVPAGPRSPAGDVGAFLLMLIVVGLLVAPSITVALLLVTVAALTVGKRVGRLLGRRLDGRSRSVRFPGVGTLNVHFSTQ